MNTQIVRLLVLALCLATPLWRASAATRVVSVYIESYAALQKQLFQGAEVFEAPQLGALPMMLTMALPGAAHINTQMPVALHLFDTGAGEAGLVMEVSPAGTPDAYLQAILGRAPASDPAPANGIHVFDGGAARISGKMVQISPSATDLAACADAAGDALPAMPDIPGTIRIVVFPSALKPWLENVKKPLTALSQSGAPNAAQTQQAVTALFDFYEGLIEQMTWLQIGIAIREDGLAFHTRMAPTAGSDLATLVASVKPVTPVNLAFLAHEDLLAFASGSYALPEEMRNQIIGLYTQMVSQAQSGDAAISPTDLAALIAPSLRLLGAPMALSANLTTHAILAQGLIGIDNAATYLNEQSALLKTPAYLSMAAQSGMSMSESETRTYKTTNIRRYLTRFDEETFKKSVRTRLSEDAASDDVASAIEEGMAPIRMVHRFLDGGYEYAAVDGALAFGMGAPAMVEQVIDRLSAPPQPAAEAERIRKMLTPSVAPCAIGRFSLSGFARIVLNLTSPLSPEAAAALPKGDAILFAKWIKDSEARSLTLIPAAEIKALKAISQAVMLANQSSFDEDEDEDEDFEDEAEEMPVPEAQPQQ